MASNMEGESQPEVAENDNKIRYLRIPKLNWKDPKKPEAKISPETEKELKEIFDIFATNDKHDKVNPNDLKEGLLIVGFNRECPEIFRVIEDLCFQYDRDKIPVSFREFVDYLNARLGDITTRVGANRIFDKLCDTDVRQITPTKLHEIIEYCGHTLSQEDVNYMLKTIFNQGTDIDINQDEFYYIMTKKPSDIDNITSVTKSK
jgi:Ca2+-binding EF-hand superfamily protein